MGYSYGEFGEKGWIKFASKFLDGIEKMENYGDEIYTTVNEIPDGGEIIMQKAVEIKDGDTPEILQKRVMEEAEWKILPLSLEKVCSELK